MQLTRREYEILTLVAQGKLNKEIALLVALSLRSVERHITNIFRKIAVSNRTEAALYYRQISNHDG